MSVFARGPLRRDRRGRYLVSLGAPERALLRMLPGQLCELLTDPSDPSLERLFPPAYLRADDVERQLDYQQLMQGELAESHQRALETLAETADAEELTEEEVLAWLHSLNSLRLVLGTRLGVSEDDDPYDTATPERQIYLLLGYLQECVIEVLAGA